MSPIKINMPVTLLDCPEATGILLVFPYFVSIRGFLKASAGISGTKPGAARVFGHK
jgi:hypothetical protein